METTREQASIIPQLRLASALEVLSMSVRLGGTFFRGSIVHLDSFHTKYIAFRHWFDT
jgi:hypothetical protein